MSRAHPALCVIIPVRDRLPELRRVLNGLILQDSAPGCFKVIMVNDGSAAATQTYLHSVENTPFELQILDAPGVGAAGARNKGLAHAHSDLVLFLDADTIPGTSLVRHHLQLHRNSDALVCHMGKIVMSQELMHADQVRWNELEFRDLEADDVEIDFRRYRTANTSLRTAAVKRAGGFNESLQAAEDLELAYRLAESGMRFYYHAGVVATHHHPITIRTYFQKGSLYGEAVAIWQRQRPDMSREIAGKFGLYDHRLPVKERLRYRLKVSLVNRWSVPFLTFLGRQSRPLLLSVSNRLFRMVYGYYLRSSHHKTMVHS